MPGVEEVIANPFRWVSLLIKLDLPTLERPINAYSGKFPAGHLVTSVLLTINSEDTISISIFFSTLLFINNF